MFSAIRKHLSPATVVAFMALVFAMTGGAFAASSGGGGTGAKATASVARGATVAIAAKAKPKAKAGPRGPAGAKGATGATGTTGPGGAAGAKGENGAAGGQGSQGPQGATGSPGAAGAAGPEGSFNKTLPSGKTLKGAWAIQANVATAKSFLEGAASTEISFGIPLAVAPTPVYVGEASGAEGTGDLTPGSNVITNAIATSGSFTKDSVITGGSLPSGSRIKKVEEESPGHFSLTVNKGPEGSTETGVALTAALPAGCAGTAGEPSAEPGYLCIYSAGEFNNSGLPGICAPEESLLGCLVATGGNTPTAGRTGASIVTVAESTASFNGLLVLNGTWAVTAE